MAKREVVECDICGKQIFDSDTLPNRFVSLVGLTLRPRVRAKKWWRHEGFLAWRSQTLDVCRECQERLWEVVTRLKTMREARGGD